MRAADGFSGNVIDTEGFNALAANDAVNHADGVLQQPILRGFYVDGNRPAFGAVVTPDISFGIRLYGRQMIVDDVRIVRTAGVGLLTQLSQIGLVTEPYHPKDHAKSGLLRDVFVYDSGAENFIFKGPTDIRIDTLYAGWAAGSLGAGYTPGLTSLHYPGETVDSVVFDNAGCEIGLVHAFDNKNGWGVRVRSDFVELEYNSATAMTGVAPGTVLTGGTSGATGVLVSKWANGWTGSLIVRPVSGTFQVGETISGGGGTATIGTVVARSPRFRCSDFMSERNFGQLWIGPQVRYEIAGEVHNNEGGNGARPMVEDNSVVGGLARLKVVRGGAEFGATLIELKGAKGIWEVQAQTNSPRAGHGIDISGTDYIVTAMVERASGVTYAGETSSGLVFRASSARNRVSAEARDCARGFWYTPGSCVDSVLALESYGHTGGTGADHFGIANLRFLERRNGRFISSAAAYSCGDMPINGPELTIAAGVIAITHNSHPVDTEGDAATDDLATITIANWVTVGTRITLRAASSARAVRVIQDGNIRLGGGAAAVTLTPIDRLVLEWDGGQWVAAASTLATVAEARAGTGTGPSSPAIDAAARILVDHGAATGIFALNPAAGPNQAVRITGPTRITAGSTLAALSGILRVRMDGPYALTFAPEILRDPGRAVLTPDYRAGNDTLFGWEVLDGRIRVWVHSIVPAVVAAPGTGTFRALYDPGAGLALVNDAGSSVSQLGDPVKWLPPVAGSWAWTGADGGAQNLPSNNRVYQTTETTNLPTLVERDGQVGVQFAAAGLGLRAQLSGLQSFGSLDASPTAPAPCPRLTWGARVFIPAGVTPGCIGSLFRAESSNTAQIGLLTDAAGLISTRARFAGSSVPQLGTLAEVTANAAVHDAQIAQANGEAFDRWMSIYWRFDITAVDTAADSDPPAAGVRGAGGTFDLWIDDGVDSMYVRRTLFSWQGANLLGRRMNRAGLCIWGSAASLTLPTNVIVGRHLITTDNVALGSAEDRNLRRWLGGA